MAGFTVPLEQEQKSRVIYGSLCVCEEVYLDTYRITILGRNSTAGGDHRLTAHHMPSLYAVVVREGGPGPRLRREWPRCRTIAAGVWVHLWRRVCDASVIGVVGI